MLAVQLGDMHHAVVAVQELGGLASAAEVALKLRWIGDDRRPDAERAKTALFAAQEHDLVGSPRCA